MNIKKVSYKDKLTFPNSITMPLDALVACRLLDLMLFFPLSTTLA